VGGIRPEQQLGVAKERLDFTAFEPQRALQSGHIELAHLAALVVVGVVSMVVALMIFTRRDAIA
jgi:hypothetical protein